GAFGCLLGTAGDDQAREWEATREKQPMKATGEEWIQDRTRALWEYTDFSATLFESLVGYAVIAADFDGTIVAFNEGARQIYGHDPRQVVGKQNIELFFPRDFMEAGYFQQVVDVLLATG